MARCWNCGADPRTDPEKAARAKAAEIRAELEAAGVPVLPGGRVREKAVARVLDVQRCTLRSWRARLQGPPYMKAGGRVLYDLVALARWMRR